MMNAWVASARAVTRAPLIARKAQIANQGQVAYIMTAALRP
jgi:hypothetical protein